MIERQTMVREIIRDDAFLSKKSTPATRDDAQIAADLLDTLMANHDRCVGMAANMIGELKRIIAVSTGDGYIIMYNPQIVKHSARHYDTKEGCLCRDIETPCRRYETIDVKYRDKDFGKRREKFRGFSAQIIQHEIDHCDGIIV